MFPMMLATVLAASPTLEVKTYALPKLLVEANAAEDKAYTVFDTRAKPAYSEGHIPGAVQLSVGPWGKAINAEKADAAFWKKELAAIGVGSKSIVLVYSDDIRDMCRAWWMFKLAGVADVRVLNGGWKAYVAAKLGSVWAESVPAAGADITNEPAVAGRA